ncbi:hypothetical protein MMC25_002293 [Agyrium rufum]|nr:hypothetical protein [Agyrium rufum]
MPQASSKVKVKAQAKSGSIARAAPSAKEVKPDWPALQPLKPREDLSLDTVLDDQIVLIHDLFTSTLCRNYVSSLSKLPLTTTPGQPKKGEALRVNDRFQIDDPDFAERLWSSTGLKELLSQSGKDWGGELCGLNPRIRIYRYSKGQFFDQHYDESNVITMKGDPPVPARTVWTLLIYLTGPTTGCAGGETVFYPELGRAKNYNGKQGDQTKPIAIGLEVGMALLHKHGNDCMLHEGREVQAGEKWIIRSDLCVKR